jgi:hypothetical protein
VTPEEMARQDFEIRRYKPEKWPDYLAGWLNGFRDTGWSRDGCGPQVYEQGRRDGAAVREGRDVLGRRVRKSS